jgi:hypothetical protein
LLWIAACTAAGGRHPRAHVQSCGPPTTNSCCRSLEIRIAFDSGPCNIDHAGYRAHPARSSWFTLPCGSRREAPIPPRRSRCARPTACSPISMRQAHGMLAETNPTQVPGRIGGPAKADESLTEHGVTIGTSRSMSPEQAQGHDSTPAPICSRSASCSTSSWRARARALLGRWPDCIRGSASLAPITSGSRPDPGDVVTPISIASTIVE